MFRNDGGSDNQGSADSTAQTGQSDGADWQEEAYQKVLQKKIKLYGYLIISRVMRNLYEESNNEGDKLEVKAMKEMYLPDLNEMHQKVSLKLQHQDSLLQMSKEQIDRLEIMKYFLERVLTFLQMPKGRIPIAHRDKMSSYDKQIAIFLNTNRGRRYIPTDQGQQQLQPSVGQTQQQQPQPKMPQLQQHDNQV